MIHSEQPCVMCLTSTSISPKRSTSWQKFWSTTGLFSCFLVSLANNVLRLQARHLGLDAAREAAKKKIQDIEFVPQSNELSEPKEGKHDDMDHQGGNTFAGGVSLMFAIFPLICVLNWIKTGVQDTAGLGGRGGYKRLYNGGNIKQVVQVATLRRTLLIREPGKRCQTKSRNRSRTISKKRHGRWLRRN